MIQLLVACADVGSVARGNFGWADCDGSSGTRPSELAEKVAAALSGHRPVALGFECPLFVPLPDAEFDLGRSRIGEGTRSWSASAGCSALATGLVQAVWTLREIRKQCPRSVGAHLGWSTFKEDGGGLLLWEAFVSGSAKGSGHVDDAAIAVRAFKKKLPMPKTDLHATNPVSLAGLSLLWAGWPVGTEALRQSCIAIQASRSN